MKPETLSEMVNAALLQWTKLLKIDETGQKKWITIGELELRHALEELNESRTLDDSDLTTWMMLRGLVEWFLKKTTFSAFEFIFEFDGIKDKIKPMRALHLLLEHPYVVELIGTFTDRVRATAVTHGFKDMEAMEKLLADKYDLAIIRRDALRSVESRLHMHQFTQGEGDKLPIGMNPNIYEIWNVNSLVAALRGQNIPGITTVLVRDPEALHSYFVLAVKNGDNITVLTDKDEEAHPAQKRMSRRPDRSLQRRAAQHWFPYDLLGVQVSEDQKRLYADARTALVPINVQAVKLAHVSDLSPEEFVWLMLVSDVLLEKLWRKNYHTPQLSYTGAMVHEPYSLVGAESSLVRKGLYEPILVEPLRHADVTSETTAAQWQRGPTYFNRWMEERYASQVPEGLFNLTTETKLIAAQHELGLVKKDRFGRSTDAQVIERLDPQNFGSREKLLADRTWAARYNQMRMIEHLANTEFDETKAGLIEWYKERIVARREFFAEAAVRGELIGPKARLNSLAYDVPSELGNFTYKMNWFENQLVTEQGNLIEAQIGGYGYYSYRGYKSYLFFSEKNANVSLSPYNPHGNGLMCFDRPDIRASITTVLTPNNPEALAMFLGIPLDELPWQMRTWYGAGLKPYDGNAILDRCDPIDWVLHNPWEALQFRVGIAFSKRAFAARRKALGLPRLKVTMKETEAEYNAKD